MSKNIRRFLLIGKIHLQLLSYTNGPDKGEVVTLISRLILKPILYSILVALATIPTVCVQAQTGGPEESDFTDSFEIEFEDEKFLDSQIDEAPQSLLEVGRNRNGQVEYSVLENHPEGRDIDVLPDAGTSDQFIVPNPLNQFLTGIVLEHLPHEYVQDKKWGSQAKRWSGVKFRRDQDDGKLETKRKYKMVNHGTWQKYSAELLNPREKFAVELSNVSRNRKGATQFDVSFDANLKLDARQAKWVKGVQLYSFGAEGDATVRLSVSCEMDVTMDLSQFPPDLVMSPKVTKAKIEIKEFKIHRVSKAGGELAQQVSRLARKELTKKIDEKEAKLVKKLNQKIEKNSNKFRLSAADAIQLKWFEQAEEHLPQEVQNAIEKSAANSLPKPTRNASSDSSTTR